MVASLHHRGPDETGTYLDHRAGLAIARLSVMDPAGGQQPYRNESGSVVAVFNGEIYNFNELREGLRSRGHQFQTGADGEVIVHLYEEHGADFPLYLNGMFAVALLDREANRFVLTRDRLGIKPLYLARVGQTLLFASQPRALLASGKVQAKLDRAALSDYLTFEYVPGPRSIFAGIEKLPPATTWVNGRTHRYWRIPTLASSLRNADEAVDELEARLVESVRRQMVSDVPLGVFLSGGLDSSTLTALAARQSSYPVQTFSIGFEDPTFDESRFARQVSAHCGTEHHHQALLASSVPDLLTQILPVLDEPLADAAVLPTLWLSQLARRNITVALSGEGADELFGGYPTYQAQWLAERLTRLPAPAITAFRAAVNRLPVSHRYLSLDFKLKRFLRHLSQPPEQRHQLWMGSFSPDDKSGLLSPDWSTSQPVSLPDLSAFAGLQRFLHQDLSMYLVDDLLVKLDRATMAVSLEGRVPYLDHTLVEFVAGLPIEWKVRGLSNKWLLKQVARRYLPPAILNRPKKGFGIPLGQWFQTSLKDMLLDAIKTLKATGIFQPAALDRLVSDHLQKRADRRKELWTLLILAGWMETWKPAL